ncbi:DUF1826 domain-containing protein [Vibrio sp. WXL210]|uniref:DUF1826 domain-containing protein n=1 Tax=Vibrio sp. WXL210 TaxID=3450709 RepID=UPI003EC88A4F
MMIIDNPSAQLPKDDIFKSAAMGQQPTALTDIYHDTVNIAIWQRRLDTPIRIAAEQFTTMLPQFEKSISTSPDTAYEDLVYATDGKADTALMRDMAHLVDMFCCLFELDQVGLRLAVLSGAMCPRFHVDNVPCRLVTTYTGVAIEWLQNSAVDRDKLGHGSQGLPDHSSGLYHSHESISQLNQGDVALLKGERWEGNEGAGLVHRSPVVTDSKPRLLLTLDMR